MVGSTGIKVSSTVGSGNSTPVRMGMYFDMDAGEVTYFSQEIGKNPRYANKIKFLPKDVVIAIAHPKHGLSATFEVSQSEEIPSLLLRSLK